VLKTAAGYSTSIRLDSQKFIDVERGLRIFNAEFDVDLRFSHGCWDYMRARDQRGKYYEKQFFEFQVSDPATTLLYV
jgi:hypothetical protein